MAYPLPDDIRKQAEEALKDHPEMKLLDPGTVLSIERRIFVTVQITATSLLLWLELPNR
jgi:hypothetical protein